MTTMAAGPWLTTRECDTAGVRDLVGRGIFLGLPETRPDSQYLHHVLIAGPAAVALSAAAQVCRWSLSTTVVIGEGKRASGLSRAVAEATRQHASVHTLWQTEIVCVDGIGHLEAVVLRDIKSGRITARPATALFLLSPLGAAPGRRRRYPRSC